MSGGGIIEITDINLINNICKFGADNGMEGATFNEILSKLLELNSNNQAQKELKPLHLVWDKPKNECVGFFDKRDATFASMGVSFSCANGVSSLADSFRDIQGDGSDNFCLQTVMVSVNSD